MILLNSRYKNTIAGHFYGHTHDDEFEIAYDDVDTTAPISMANIGPSVTTYSFRNPAFRVYTVDGDYDGSSWVSLQFLVEQIIVPWSRLSLTRRSCRWS